jgi:O-antigen/teichoic acid export membrane protein
VFQSPIYLKYRHWISRTFSFGILQVGVQGLTAVSGILLVRMLSKTEYSYYTIAVSMSSLISTLSDLGIGVGLMSIGGRVWQSRTELGSVLGTALSERKRLGLPAAFAITVALVFLLIRAGCSYSYAFGLSFLVLANFFIQFPSSFFAVALKLHSQIVRIQSLELFAAAVRLMIIGILVYLAPNATTGLIAMAAVGALQVVKYSSWAHEIADLSQPPAVQYSKEIRQLVLSLTPNVLFGCVQSQIPILLLTLFGRTSSVADLGALGRLAMLFAILGAFNYTVLQPAFARLHTRDGLTRGFRLIFALNSLIGLFCVILAMMFPSPFLWILGSKYANLSHELVLAVTVAALSLVSNGVFGVAAAKGWMQKAWLIIPITILSQIVSVLAFDLRTVKGVLLFSIAGQVCTIVFWLYRILTRINIAPSHS